MAPQSSDDTPVFLTRRDRDAVQLLFNDYRRRLTAGAQSRYSDTPADPQAPEVYIARTPAGGIPAVTGTAEGSGSTGTGTGGMSEAGSAVCDLYRLLPVDDDNPVIVKIELQKLVYNVSTNAVPALTWCPVFKDKFGAWIALVGGNPSGGVGWTPGMVLGGGGDTYTVQPYVLQLGVWVQDTTQAPVTAYRMLSNIVAPTVFPGQMCQVRPSPEDPGAYDMTPWGALQRYKTRYLIDVDAECVIVSGTAKIKLTKVYEVARWSAVDMCKSPASVSGG